MFNSLQALSQTPYGEDEYEVIQLNRFPLGENTALPAPQLLQQELASCIDYKIELGGRLKSRPPFSVVSTVALASGITHAAVASINGTEYILTASGSKIYYLNGSNALIEIGEVASANIYLTPYNNTCLISDGSFLKQIVSLTAIGLCYDDGDGDTAHYYNLDGSADGTLDTTTYTRIATKFTTKSWDTGFTIPITKVKARVLETSASADITFRLRKVSDDSILAEKAYTGTVPTAAVGEIEIEFDAADITTEMSPDTEYYISLEGTKFEVEYTTVASGGTAVTYTPSAWAADTTKNLNLAVWPDVPPKSDFCVIHGNSPILVDPDEPGRIKFGNQTHLDWSTPNEAGWIGVLDDSKNSFKVGALAILYQQLIIFGTEDWPFTARLTGTDPSDYQVVSLFQSLWSTQRLVQNAGNELWASSKIGAFSFSGVEMFGDVRTEVASDPILDVFTNWSTNAISGYNPKDGQYWFYIPGQSYIHVCHVKQAMKHPDGGIRYPWTRYSLPSNATYSLEPRFFGFLRGEFYIGSNDGYLYKQDASLVQDFEAVSITPVFKSAYVDMIFNNVDIEEIQAIAYSRTGLVMSVDFFINGYRVTEKVTHEFAFPMAEDVTLAELEDTLLSEVEDFLVTPGEQPIFKHININAFSMQIECNDVTVIGQPIYFDGFLLKVRKLKE